MKVEIFEITISQKLQFHFTTLITGREEPEPCDPGFYQPFVKQVNIDACAKCISGYFCDEVGLDEPKDCPANHYCPPYDEIANNGNCNGCDTSDSINSGGTEFRCPPGRYSDSENLRTEAECPACPAGDYCPNFAEDDPQPCLPGYYCPGGTAVGNEDGCTDGVNDAGYDCAIICPIGTYCTEGSFTPRMCVEGTFTRNPGSESDADCVNCEAGYFCSREVIIDGSSVFYRGMSGFCEAGYAKSAH